MTHVRCPACGKRVPRKRLLWHIQRSVGNLSGLSLAHWRYLVKEKADAR